MLFLLGGADAGFQAGGIIADGLAACAVKLGKFLNWIKICEFLVCGTCLLMGKVIFIIKQSRVQMGACPDPCSVGLFISEQRLFVCNLDAVWVRWVKTYPGKIGIIPAPL